MKKKIVIIIIVIVCLLFLTLGLLLFTDLLFEGKYNVLKERHKPSFTEEEKVETENTSDLDDSEDNNTYIYACLPNETDDENSIISSLYFTVDRDNINENFDKCDKYKITCTDINNKQYDCHDIYIEIETSNGYPYFTYMIKGKQYIKNFKNNKFVIEPKEYDNIKYLGDYINIYKGNHLKVFNCILGRYFNDEWYELQYIKKYLDEGYETENIGESEYFILKKGNIKIFDKYKNKEYLKDVQKDRILYMNDDRFFIQDGNKIKLYDRNGLLWDYGKFDNINNIQFYEIPGANINYEAYVFNNKKNFFSLNYNPKTKKGSKE